MADGVIRLPWLQLPIPLTPTAVATEEATVVVVVVVTAVVVATAVAVTVVAADTVVAAVTTALQRDTDMVPLQEVCLYLLLVGEHRPT